MSTSFPEVPLTMLFATTQSFGLKAPPSLSITALVPSTVLKATVTRSGRSCSLLVGPLSASLPEPNRRLPSTTVRLPCRSTRKPRLSRIVLYRTVLSDDLTEIASASPFAFSNRLCSTTAFADFDCLWL